jgi:endonuclease/exonuclease/phosphatase family metal-dependent hydrolase
MDNRSIAHDQQRVYGHPFEPVVVNRPPSKARTILKVVVFNAAGGRFLSQALECLRRPPIEGADIILLCEAGWRLRQSAGREFAAELAQELGMSFAFMAEFGMPRSSRPLRAFMGNAILSSQPLSQVCAVPLVNLFLHPRVRRMVGAPCGLIAKASFHGRPITVGVAHLNSRWDPAGRERQMRDYLAQFPRDGAALIGGDFNTTTVDLRTGSAVIKALGMLIAQRRRLREPMLWEPLFERMAESGFDVRGANACGKPTFTFNRMIPPLIRPKLDWIALRGLEPVPQSAEVIPARSSPFGRRISDHDFVVCDIRL